MDPLHFLEDEDLLQFLRCKKTEISCLDKPQIFICQLRDLNLVEEDQFKRMIRMKGKETRRRALYEVLDLLETKRSSKIKVFWSCVFNENIMSTYPTLRILRNSLLDGSYKMCNSLLEGTEKQETGKKIIESSQDSEGIEKERHTNRKKRKTRTMSVHSEEEMPGPSTQLTPGSRSKSLKGTFTPLRKEDKNSLLSFPLYGVQIPVTCGEKTGYLHRNKLAKGERCIVVNKQWYSPMEFERFAGREKNKNWRRSIRCWGTPLEELIRDGRLTAHAINKNSKAKKVLFPPLTLSTESHKDTDEDELEDTSSHEEESSPDSTDDKSGEEAGCSPNSNVAVCEVSCGTQTGTLHVKRFASGICGKSIRTETRWMTPVEFVSEESSQTDTHWKKDIQCDGNTLHTLIEAKVLRVHSLLCKCKLCKPDEKEMEGQKNDDECFACGKEGQLVLCDSCPRSFHQMCHLPHVPDTSLRDRGMWDCTFCVFGYNQRLLHHKELSRSLALSCPISSSSSPSLMQCHYLLLTLYNADNRHIFAKDPSQSVKGYTDYIENPMWFDKVVEKLEEKMYQTVGDLVSDIQLILSNCADFNKDNTEFRNDGVRLSKLFERELKNAFFIREEAVD